MGDLILTLPMASAIKRARPEATVIFVVGSYTAPLASMAPDIDEVVVVEENPSYLQLVRSFLSLRADAVLFPNPDPKLALAAWMARIPIRIGTKFRGYSFLFNRLIGDHRKTAEMSEAAYNIRMLAPLGIEVSEPSLPNILIAETIHQRALERLRDAFAGRELPYAVLHIASSGSSKEWPIERFEELIRELALHSVPGFLLTGTSEERHRLEAVRQKLQPTKIPIAILTDLLLPELAAVLASAAVVVSNSTGPGHLAAALEVPTIGLFPLPTALSKQRWGFRGIRTINLSPAPIEGCPTCATCTCMERLSVESVKNVAEALLMDADRRSREAA